MANKAPRVAYVAPDPCQVFDDFMALVDGSPDPVYVGIDPGSHGAIAFSSGTVYAVTDIPVIVMAVKRSRNLPVKVQRATGRKTRTVDGTTTKADYSGITRLFQRVRTLKSRIKVVLEEAPTSTGPGRSHADVILNRAYAMWPLFLYYNGYSVEEVRPSVWKAKMGLTGQDKKYSLMKARSMFPKADLPLAEHHDRAEALLLTDYLRRQHAGG